MANIFLSYRRDDSGGYAGRVQDRLVKEFGTELLFMDVDAIPLGANFAKVLHQRVSECNVLLAVIGPHWLDAQDEYGNRRLNNPKDYERIEIAAALQRDIPVIPILLDNTRIPKADQLPDEIKELSLRNGLNVHLASFHSDCDRLIQGLKAQLKFDGPPEKAQHAPLKRSQTQIRAGVLAGVGGIGALLSLAVLITMVSNISTVEQNIEIFSSISLLYASVTWAFCGAITGLLKPRYGILKAAAMMTGLKFLLGLFFGLAFGSGTITLGSALFSAGWFGISIFGIIMLYEWTQRRLART
jgi:hypothetical protein